MNLEIRAGLGKIFGAGKEGKENDEFKKIELEKIEKGLEANILRMENNPQEIKGELIGNYVERLRRQRLKDINDILTDKGREEAEKIFNDKIFNEWKKYFWGNEEKYLEMPKPKNAVEQALLWNSCQGPLEEKIMDGFKQVGQLVTKKEELGVEGVLPANKRTAEITIVDREKDKKLSELCEWAKNLKDEIPDEEERIFLIAQEVFKRMGDRLDKEGERDEIKKMEEGKRELLLGDVEFGMCRHRDLLFHILADEAEVRTRMMKMIGETIEWGFPTVEGHQYSQAFLKNGEMLIVDTMFPPGGRNKKEFEKYFEELSYKEFKAKGGFPCFGSNRLPFNHYQDSKVTDRIQLVKSFQGGRIGVNGLKKLLGKE